ncbi:DNA polymerase-3 subunit epsilon [Dyadobacter jejuensis]|uniref:DNA polymerase-3 subunit epsilon n=1 Tax=Dyadobacter jejuensis TaxID=1082580 RepID=A0A316AN89_9BACT|nr:3'-5' exonuclease [Dyadobacter jejuensis]PWJ59016.1 DNA polymerase-3 subunit epsilon [Dyadobacter jejuensis]
MPFLVLDIEMTGPEPGWNEIIQLGAELFDDQWNSLSTYLTNVYPENEESFSSRSEQIHGLSMEDLEEAPMIYEVIPEFENWIKKHNGNRPNLSSIIICGQSVINDINFLRHAYSHEKMRWPFSNKLIDLHTVSYMFFQVLQKNGQTVPRSLSLASVAAYFGFEREGDQHNALEDAQLTALCFKAFFKLIDRLKLND